MLSCQLWFVSHNASMLAMVRWFHSTNFYNGYVRQSIPTLWKYTRFTLKQFDFNFLWETNRLLPDFRTNYFFQLFGSLKKKYKLNSNSYWWCVTNSFTFQRQIEQVWKKVAEMIARMHLSSIPLSHVGFQIRYFLWQIFYALRSSIVRFCVAKPRS